MYFTSENNTAMLLKKKKQISLTEYTFLTMQKFKYRLTSVLH